MDRGSLLPTRCSRWRKLRNVLRAVTLFKHFDTVECDVDMLVTEIRRIPSDPVYRKQKRERKEHSAAYVAIQDIRREDRFFRAIETGGPEDLNLLIKEIEDDPYRLLRDASHPLSLVNKRNRAGQTPLYVACKNGNLTIAALLLSRGADPLIYSEVEGQVETNLQVAARWGHAFVVEKLLRGVQWSMEALDQAYVEATTMQVKKLLSLHRKKKCCCF